MKRCAAVAAAALCVPLLLASLDADAGRVYRWKDRYGVNQYVDQPPAASDAPASAVEARHYASPASVQVSMRLEADAGGYKVWADNRLHAPVEVSLRLKRGAVVATPALPARSVVPARGSLLLVHLVRREGSDRGDFELLLDALPGDPAARHADYAYRIPFDRAKVQVDQGPGGSFSHADAENLHALDFALPEGTPILAARAGVVVQVQSGFEQSGVQDDYGGLANHIRILHQDGSMALYAHLQPDGVQVHPGQRVAKGQLIGQSGNTGLSTAPHLHFVVQVNRGMHLVSVPVRIAAPLGELRFPEPPAAAGSTRQPL